MKSGVRKIHFEELNCFSSYLLGLLWADGYVVKKYRYEIRLEMIYDDFVEIEHVFNKVGKWSIFNRDREGRQKQRIASVTNKGLHSYLKELNYCKKSYCSANKVLQIIPDDLKCFWWRGLVDGDGCFYINKKHHNYQFTLGGSFEQDWSYVENLFTYLDIYYRILRRTQKKSRNSIVQITRRKDIGKLFDYIYQGEFFGLSRKYEKAIICKGEIR